MVVTVTNETESNREFLSISSSNETLWSGTVSTAYSSASLARTTGICKVSLQTVCRLLSLLMTKCLHKYSPEWSRQKLPGWGDCQLQPHRRLLCPWKINCFGSFLHHFIINQPLIRFPFSRSDYFPFSLQWRFFKLTWRVFLKVGFELQLRDTKFKNQKRHSDCVAFILLPANIGNLVPN